MKALYLFWLSLAFFTSAVMASQKAPSWINEGPYLERSPAYVEVPVKVFATKLYVEVVLGGKPRRFVLDTGSPSMIDTALVEELGLKVIDTNKGLDAHGAVVETEVVQASIRIGNIDIHKLPMMAANFSKSEITKSFIGDGVLGSDLLPLGIWQFDLNDSVLRFSSSLAKLPNINRAKKLKLYQFGYPYMPIFDVHFAKDARSKAMFDTGSPALFAISSPDLDGAEQNSGVGKTVTGYGSPGSSLGGQSPDTELLLVELNNLAIDSLKLGTVVAEKRNLVPSLIGARVLEKYVITLDSRAKEAYFTEYSNKPFKQTLFGFALAFNNSISIGAVWDDSPAKVAGLRAGMDLISINGVDVEFTQQGLFRALTAMQGEEIKLVWKGGEATLTRENLIDKE